jgi:choline dehydrogenase-like flavoprotein
VVAVAAQPEGGGRKLTVHAPRVVAACGTFLSPQLLRSNGIGRGNRHLGRHLTIHPASKVVAEFDEVINSWEGIPQAYCLDAFHDDGIMFEGIAMPPDLGPAATPFSGQRLAHYIKRYRNMSTFGFMIRDTAEGRLVRLPLLGYAYRYSLTATDVRRVKKAVAFLARLFLNGGARRVYPMVASRANEFTTLEDVDRFEQSPLQASAIEMMAFHPLGTCRMAATPELGVCGPWHEVFGTPGLHICDGSAVPTALGVNPQETIMALATRLAEHLLDGRLSESQ